MEERLPWDYGQLLQGTVSPPHLFPASYAQHLALFKGCSRDSWKKSYGMDKSCKKQGSGRGWDASLFYRVPKLAAVFAPSAHSFLHS